MKRRQPLPSRWFVADERTGRRLWPGLRAIRPGGGVLILYRDLPKRERAVLLAKLRRAARQRRLALADEEAGEAARVHDLAELRQALLRRTPLLFLSPMFETQAIPIGNRCLE